jgi:hypothetical protein
MNVESERVSFWSSHWTAWQSSGLSQRAYCHQHGLSYSAFGYWRSRVRGAAITPPPTFVPVLVEAPAVKREEAAAADRPETVIHSRRGAGRCGDSAGPWASDCGRRGFR